MESKIIEGLLEASIDALAEVEHERWAHWQRYMHSKGERRPDGALVLPAELVSRWEEQLHTPYDRLSDEEKESDREQVRRYIPAVSGILSD